MGKHEYGVDAFRFRGECRECGHLVRSYAKRAANPRGMWIRCRECDHICWASDKTTVEEAYANE